MARSSNTNRTLDQDQQADADASPPSVEVRRLLHQSPTNTDIMPSSSGAELAHSQSERAGTDTFQISVNSANVQTYEAPAVAAVLQTNELLHLIISEVPRSAGSQRRGRPQWKR
jgi:hypothetical protein